MTNLKYKTRGSSSPQGKPRVYFCCHPKDFNSYFHTISDEILEKHDCAIWYTDAARSYDEGFFSALDQMQLFVMPITTNLLCTENGVLDYEFNFAVRNHIPVLPLMYENRLEELFGNKCGDLQFLDRSKIDTSAISYHEKLEKYLSSVLLGDELTNKIRAAFDAYIFLSYRKKDRKYAQKLMRLIHKNEFCRDIAIWYDEFLTPGEDFNDSIKEALQKSSLFILTVTPNLINEINYIMTTEYPLAQQEKKPIIPVEFVPTNKDQLGKKYEGIPEIVNAYNDTELSNVLLKEISKIAIKENGSSVEHSFFIGLAYLNGIDVETDHLRAVELITNAAASGLIEAIKQLVNMYRNGHGVQRDYITAITWQKKLIDTLRIGYEQTNDETSLSDYQVELNKLGDYYLDLGLLSNAESVFISFLENCSNVNDTDLKNTFLSSGYYKLGNVYKAIGDISKAKYYYQECLKTEPDLTSVHSIIESALVYIELGGITDDTFYYEQVLDIVGSINQESSTDVDNSVLVLLSSAYSGLGNAYQSKGMIKQAIFQYRKAVHIDEQLLTRQINPIRDKSNYITNMLNLALALEQKLKYREAFSYYQRCLELAENLVEETEAVDTRLLLALCYSGVASSYVIVNNLSISKRRKLAQEYHVRSVKLLEELAEKADTIYCHSQLVLAYLDIAYDYYFESNELNANLYFEKALLICDKFEGNEHFKGLRVTIEECLRKSKTPLWRIFRMMYRLTEIIEACIHRKEHD